MKPLRVRDYLFATARSECDMSDMRFANRFLRRVFEMCGEDLAPTHFNGWEPINKSFAGEGIEGALAFWKRVSPDGGTMYLKRRPSPQYVIMLDWVSKLSLNRERFHAIADVSFNSTRCEDLATRFLALLIEVLSPPFAKSAIDSDVERKHLLITQEANVQTEQFIGVIPGDYIPGIYWKTYLGPWAVDRVGRRRIETLPVGEVTKMGEGYLITAYPHATHAGTEYAMELEIQIRRHLGEQHFFDIDRC